MTNCSVLYKSKKVQKILEKGFKENANALIKEKGGLPEFYWRDFKKGYKRGFMKTCKKQIKSNKRNKTNKNK
jgi:hypothetical protein